MDFEHVLVVGAGQMGGGIAQVVAGSGRRVSLYDAAPGAVDRGLETMRRSLGKLAEKGGPDPDEVLGRVEPVGEIVAADLMIEAVIEDAAVKEDVFRRAHETLPPEAVLASNTSSIPISTLAAATGRPDRVIGMHFFNPVPMMSLVEVVRGKETSDETAEAITALAPELGKTPARELLPGLRLEPDPDAVHQRGRLGAPRGRRRSRRRSTRSRSSGSPIRWGRSRSPT